MDKIYNMSMQATLEVISGKWKPIILCKLGHQPRRSGELLREIPNITQKMLTQQLRQLENDNIVKRTIYQQVPPKVVYSLTSEGKTLKEVLVVMSLWGDDKVKRQQDRGDSVVLLSDEFDGFLNL